MEPAATITRLGAIKIRFVTGRSCRAIALGAGTAATWLGLGLGPLGGLKGGFNCSAKSEPGRPEIEIIDSVRSGPETSRRSI